MWTVKKDQLMELDDKRYLAANVLVHARCDQLRAEARFLLSEHLREPSAISRLSEQGITVMMETAAVEGGHPEAIRKPLDLPGSERQPISIPT